LHIHQRIKKREGKKTQQCDTTPLEESVATAEQLVESIE
jgi:hypothetical protein